MHHDYHFIITEFKCAILYLCLFVICRYFWHLIKICNVEVIRFSKLIGKYIIKATESSVLCIFIMCI